VARPHSSPGVMPSITCGLPALPMAQMRPSLMPTSAFTTPSTASMIVTLVITRSGAPPARVIRLSMPMPSRRLLPPPKTISSPGAPRRSRSISTNRPVSPRRMRSPVVGPNRPTYSLREMVAIGVLAWVGLRLSASSPAGERKPRFAASATALRLAGLGGLAGGGAVDQVVESVHGALAEVRHQAHLALVAGLEADRGRCRNVQVLSEGGGAVELERAVHFEEVEVRADLHRSVTGVAHLQRGDRQLLVKRRRPPCGTT
jgi:hypothetical protein